MNAETVGQDAPVKKSTRPVSKKTTISANKSNSAINARKEVAKIKEISNHAASDSEAIQNK